MPAHPTIHFEPSNSNHLLMDRFSKTEIPCLARKNNKKKKNVITQSSQLFMQIMYKLKRKLKFQNNSFAKIHQN
jgi:hypothetical protein